ITNDIAVGLRTPTDAAEKIKQRYGCALASLVSPEETVEVPSVGGRQPRVLQRQVLVDIVSPRVEEILEHVRKEIVKAGFEDLLAGTTALEGTVELAEEVVGFPARRGVPRGIGGLVDVVKSPAYATGVGLVLYGVRALARTAIRPTADKGMWKRMRNWFGEMF